MSEQATGSVVVELELEGRWAISLLTEDWKEGEIAALNSGDEEAMKALRDAAVQRVLAEPDDIYENRVKVHLNSAGDAA